MKNGVDYRSVEDIRHRMLEMTKMYNNAKREINQSGNGAKGSTNVSGSEEFKSKLIIANVT